MKWTRFLIPTLKETPADAVVPSHRLMLRAGLMRQVAAGAYAYLPLGHRTLRKIEQIVREEMNRAGAVELHMPAMQPLELWQETNRDEAMGPTLVRLADKPFRRNTVLGPTHEEVVTDIVRAYVSSYKQLPITLYQIQTKFRDEERPKSGVLRTREFLMKDAYSFNPDKASLDASYEEMYAAYCRIYERCGLPYIAVEAESGPIGGDASHEFMVVTDAGEDWLVRSQDGSYAANVERADFASVEKAAEAAPAELKEVHTPHLSTIEQVSAFLKCRPADMIKTLIYDADGTVVVALVRGDHEINESRLRRHVGANALALAAPATIEKVTGAAVGFAGPVGLKGVRIVADQAVTVMQNAVTGANKTDYHLTGVNIGRDFEIAETATIRFAVEGDKAPNGSPLDFEKCIEVGHVFKLGTKYSAAMKANFLDENGKNHPIIMGCYGIGLNRIMAAAIEAGHDENGIIWPLNIAPYTVAIVALDVREAEVMSAAEQIHDALEAQGIDVLLDDRDARPGFKFKDADLIGIPLRITIGKRGLGEGIVEFKRRSGGDVEKIPVEQVAQHIADIVTQERK
ncbi:MAG TPA: proline--tRNA ligase [Phycisphaerae bacterium]|nr:proline--tRNA ligase [Phycisphaerales bacterium]HRX85423.1 proline--tRNA ligase [Phycisphaerae bacterium]